LNAGESWSLNACTFEGTDNGDGLGMTRAYYDNRTGSNIVWCMTLTGCWIGDSNAHSTSIPWISCGTHAGHSAFYGLVLQACLVSGQHIYAPGLGFSILGGSISQIDYGLETQSGVVAGCVQTVAPLHYNQTKYVTILGTSNFSTGAAREHLWVRGHLKTAPVDQTLPTKAVGAAGGVGATIEFDDYSPWEGPNDVAGWIKITTGTSCATGILGTITFAEPYDNGSWGGGWNKKPSIVLTPASAGAAAIRVWAEVIYESTTPADGTPTASRVTKFNIRAVDVPAEATELSYSYVVVG
jgi:hypothetical protein